MFKISLINQPCRLSKRKNNRSKNKFNNKPRLKVYNKYQPIKNKRPNKIKNRPLK